MTLWPPEAPPGRGPSLDPPPISRSQTDGGRTGNKSTSLHNRERVSADDLRAAIRARSRLRTAEREEDAHVVERRMRRSVRASIGRIVAERSGSIESGHPRRELWQRLAVRFPSCEYVKPIRNGLTGTVIGFPFSCRVPGCPHCEHERVDRLRERYLPYVRAATAPKVLYLTMPHRTADGELVTGPGTLAARWSDLTAAFNRLRRSPLFTGVDRKGRPRRCRPGRVGCLAELDEVALAVRRWCRGRCQRDGWHADAGVAVGASHPACRPCLGHRPVSAALIALETTISYPRPRSNPPQWHPHANVLFDGPFIPQDVLCWAWGRALGVGKAWVWIRDATKPPRSHKGERWTVDKALWETVKYAVKPDDRLVDSAHPSWYVEWVEARDGRRLVRSYGAWFGLADDDEDDEPAGLEATVDVTDPDSGRCYRLPALDPLTDEPADWMLLPGDMPRHRFAHVLPPGDGRRRWLVTHDFARFGGDVDPP